MTFSNVEDSIDLEIWGTDHEERLEMQRELDTRNLEELRVWTKRVKIQELRDVLQFHKESSVEKAIIEGEIARRMQNPHENNLLATPLGF